MFSTNSLNNKLIFVNAKKYLNVRENRLTIFFSYAL